MQFERIEKHIFSGIADYFRLFLTDALTPLCIVTHNTRVWEHRKKSYSQFVSKIF